MSKKSVKITENELVELIDNIVVESKKQWLAEQELAKGSILENKIAKLEAKVKAISGNK